MSVVCPSDQPGTGHPTGQEDPDGDPVIEVHASGTRFAEAKVQVRTYSRIQADPDPKRQYGAHDQTVQADLDPVVEHKGKAQGDDAAQLKSHKGCGLGGILSRIDVHPEIKDQTNHQWDDPLCTFLHFQCLDQTGKFQQNDRQHGNQTGVYPYQTQ